MESEFYLQARREWDERNGDLVLGKRNWQITSAGLMLLSLILTLGIVWMSARTKVIPFIVEVDKLGYAITIPTPLTASATPATVERMKRYDAPKSGQRVPASKDLRGTSVMPSRTPNTAPINTNTARSGNRTDSV